GRVTRRKCGWLGSRKRFTRYRRPRDLIGGEIPDQKCADTPNPDAKTRGERRSQRREASLPRISRPLKTQKSQRARLQVALATTLVGHLGDTIHGSCRT